MSTDNLESMPAEAKSDGEIKPTPAVKPTVGRIVYTLKELIIERLDDVQTKRSKKYYAENRRYLKMFLEHFGNIDISNISRRDVFLFVNTFARYLKSNNRTYEKANAMIRILRATFNIPGEYNPVKGVGFFPFDKKLKYIPTTRILRRSC